MVFVEHTGALFAHNHIPAQASLYLSCLDTGGSARDGDRQPHQLPARCLMESDHVMKKKMISFVFFFPVSSKCSHLGRYRQICWWIVSAVLCRVCGCMLPVAQAE